MKTLEEMAQEINRLNCQLAEQKSISENIGIRNIELESIIYNFKFRVDLDGDAIFYNRLVSHSDREFGLIMESIRRHKDRWGIKGNTF